MNKFFLILLKEENSKVFAVLSIIFVVSGFALFLKAHKDDNGVLNFISKLLVLIGVVCFVCVILFI